MTYCHKNENSIQTISTAVNGRQIVKIKNSMIKGQYNNSWSALTDVKQHIIMKKKQQQQQKHLTRSCLSPVS